MVDGLEILNLDRIDNQFMNITKRKESNALSDKNKVFCTNLLKRNCHYLDRTFPGGQIIGRESGKWNAAVSGLNREPRIGQRTTESFF